MGGLRLAVVVCMAVGACGQNFMPTGPMTTARVNQTAVVLANGDVLLAGGGVGSSPSLSTAAIYDPATGTFTPTGSLQAPRTDAVATLVTAGVLKGQAILIGGNNGDSDNAYASTEIYDPVAGSFRFGPMMPFAIGLPYAVSLPDGKIVVFGLEPDPSCRSGPCISSWTVYDPAANAFTSSGEMPVDVADFEAAALQDNEVLIAGGLASGAVMATAALFDPGNGAFTPTGPMQTPRARGIAVALSDGSVLIAGGVENVAPSGSLTSAEIYSPKTGKFSPAGNLPASLTLVGSSATLLSNGEVLLAGGGSPTLSSLADAEIYDPVHRTFISAGQMDAARSRFTATLLQNGNVLIAGGLSFPPAGSQATTDLASAELYAPASAPHPNFFCKLVPIQPLSGSTKRRPSLQSASTRSVGSTAPSL